MSEKENVNTQSGGDEDVTLDLDLDKDSAQTPVDSETTTPVTTPRKQSGVPPGVMASPARSSAVTIVGGGKRQRMASGNGASSAAAATGSFGALGAVPPSPPKFASLEEIVSAATGVKNMALAHEIAVDKDFHIKKADFPPTSFEGTFKSILHKAFWDLMEERLKEDPPDFESAISVFEDVKKLMDAILLPQHQRLRKQIDDVLDMEVIRQQVDAGTIEPYTYTAFVLDLMSKLCAPARDEDIARLRQLQSSQSDLVKLFRGILETLELMRIDMANFTIQQMRPFIQSQSVEYEKTKFADFLKTQTDGLLHTRLWLKSALDAAQNASAASASADVAVEGAAAAAMPPPTPAAILIDAFVSLLFWDDTQPFPETLLMDEGRLLHLRDEFYRIILIGGLLLVIYNVVGAPIAGLASLKGELKVKILALLGPIASEVKDDNSGAPLIAPFTSDEAAKTRHRSQLKEKLTQVFETTKTDVIKSLTDHGFPPPSALAWESLKGQLVGMEASDDHPVMKIVFKRLTGFVKSVMTMEGKTNVQIPPGLSGMQKEIIDLVASFMRIVTHNRAVFGDYYQDIIQTLTRPTSA